MGWLRSLDASHSSARWRIVAHRPWLWRYLDSARLAARKLESAGRRRTLPAALAVSLLIGACANNQEGGKAIGAITGAIIGNQFGKGSGKVATTLAGEVVGGIVGNSVGSGAVQYYVSPHHRTRPGTVHPHDPPCAVQGQK